MDEAPVALSLAWLNTLTPPRTQTLVWKRHCVTLRLRKQRDPMT